MKSMSVYFTVYRPVHAQVSFCMNQCALLKGENPVALLSRAGQRLLEGQVLKVKEGHSKILKQLTTEMGWC